MNEFKPVLPTILYRAFDRRDHARAFVSSGSLRFRALEAYRELEDARRRDSAEGFARLRVPPPSGEGHISYTHRNINPTYVLCTAMDTVDLGHLARQYGPHIVRINKPEQFFQDLHDHLRSSPYSKDFVLDAKMVSYTLDDAREAEPQHDEMFRLAYTQKSVIFAPDCEFRFALVRIATDPRQDLREKAPYIGFELGKRLRYCDLLPNTPLQPTGHSTAGG
jgi:hypothetical protein